MPDDDAAAEFRAIAREFEPLLKRAVQAFADWTAANWKITEEQWRKDFEEAPPTGSYFDGYNAAMDNVRDAAKAFVGEFLGC